jgi:hypothetical protein
MGPRLLALAGLLARRYGPAAAARLARAARGWLADPANARARDELLGQLRGWASRASGAAAGAAALLAREIEVRRRRSVAAWEREVIARRMDLAGAAPGPAREAALSAYAEEAESAAAILAASARPGEDLALVRAAVAAERGMLSGERIGRSERDRALRALDRALAACERAARR